MVTRDFNADNVGELDLTTEAYFTPDWFGDDALQAGLPDRLGSRGVMTTPRLEARGVGKTFGAATVLRDASLVVRPGEIHALVGQNGCGKSTLIKILTGYHAPDAGMSLAVDGQQLSLPVQWRAARAAGVSVVHQDLGLLDDLTREREHRHRWVRRAAGSRDASTGRRRTRWPDAVLERLELPVSPRDLVGDLPRLAAGGRRHRPRAARHRRRARA